MIWIAQATKEIEMKRMPHAKGSKERLYIHSVRSGAALRIFVLGWYRLIQ